MSYAGERWSNMDLGLRPQVKEAMLAGCETAKEICGFLRVPDADGLVKASISLLLKDGAFLKDVEDSRAQIETVTIQWFKKRALKYAGVMDRLTDSKDPRVQFQAAKDALDRIGTKPENKIHVSGIEQYEQLMRELMKEPEKGGE